MNKGRPKKKRTISCSPRVHRFSPRGVAGRPDYEHIGQDELEAIRLADAEKLNHTAGARKMGISRQTFGRILKSGRSTVARALVNGKIIMVGRGRERKG